LHPIVENHAGTHYPSPSCPPQTTDKIGDVAKIFGSQTKPIALVVGDSITGHDLNANGAIGNELDLDWHDSGSVLRAFFASRTQIRVKATIPLTLVASTVADLPTALDGAFIVVDSASKAFSTETDGPETVQSALAAPPTAAESKPKGKGKKAAPAAAAPAGLLRGEVMLDSGNAAPSAPVVSTKLSQAPTRRVHVRLDVVAYLENSAPLGDAARTVIGALGAQLASAAEALDRNADAALATFVFHLPVLQGPTSCPFHAVYPTAGSADPVAANTEARKQLHQLLALPLDRSRWRPPNPTPCGAFRLESITCDPCCCCAGQ